MKDIKKAPITLSKVFPTSHTKAGLPTFFRRKVENGIKIHTIRSNYDWWKGKVDKINSGEMYLSLREWTSKPYYSLQEEWGKVESIGLQKITITKSEDLIKVIVDGKEVPLSIIAENDGIEVDDLVEFLFKKGKKINCFDGVIIHFTKFRY